MKDIFSPSKVKITVPRENGKSQGGLSELSGKNTKASTQANGGLGESGSLNNTDSLESYTGSGLPGGLGEALPPGSLLDLRLPREDCGLDVRGGRVNPSEHEIRRALDDFGGRSGGGIPSSLDNCDQVSKDEQKTEELGSDQAIMELCQVSGVENRAWYKRALVDTLDVCGRHGEAFSVNACGEDFRVGKCLDCGASPAFPLTCDHRLCPDCASRRGAILVSEHEDMLKQLRYPKMLTLTFLSVAHLDREYIKWARNCFRKLRRRKVMASCWGGIYSFEVTHSDKFGWHLHIHALIGSSYIDQGELSREWEKITGAKIMDIRAIWGKAKWKGVREVVKYPAKIVTFLGSPDLVNEFLTATEGVNLAHGFGGMYRVKTKRHSEGRLHCPVCGGRSISFNTWDAKRHGWESEGGFGFVVPRSVIQRVKGGYLWRSPPEGGIL